MKDIKDIINESIITEGSIWKSFGPTLGKGFDMATLTVRPNKEFGFITYDEDGESVHLIAADSAEDMAVALNLEHEEFEEFFKLKVGQVEKNIVNNTYTLRIW